MHPFFEKVERYNRKLILPAAVILLFIIIDELFLHLEHHAVVLGVEIADYLIITIFVIDLIFLGIKARSVKFFFKNYWLDLLAVFPFALIFRLVGDAWRLFSVSELALGQTVLHESLEVSKAAVKAEEIVQATSKTAREAEEIAKVSRTLKEADEITKIGRSLRIGSRVVRFVTKGVPRFERQKLKHVRRKEDKNAA